MEQCKGTTKSGNRCKNSQGLVNGYCRLHGDQVPASEKITSDEEPRDIPREEDLSFTDVASDLNKGVSTIWLVITVLLSIILFWVFKGKKKQKE